MSLLTGSLVIDFVLALVTLLGALYWYITNNDDYWEKRGVPHVKKGLLLQSILGRKSQYDAVDEIYQTFHGKRFGGFFHVKRPMLMILDPELITRVLVKDFSSFQDRGMGGGNRSDPITSSLFSQNGQMWRAMRFKLTPTFSAGKLKNMFEQLSKSGDNMMEVIEELIANNADIECKEFLVEFTLDVVASVAFGLKFNRNSLEFIEFKNTVHEIHKNQSPLKFVRLAILSLFPQVGRFIRYRPFPKEVGDYFVNLAKSNLKYRMDNKVQRNDYFQLLMSLKEQEDSGKEIIPTDPNEDDTVVNQMEHAEKDTPQTVAKTKLFDENTISANTFVFLSAGTESTSSAITMILFELTQHQDVQRKLQAEVDSVIKNQGGWSFQAIKEMTYLDQIMQESQRLYPNFAHHQRVCIQPYKIPDSDVVIEKGTLISIPHYSIQRDPQYYDDPLQFRPERFEGNSFKPNSTFLPFGDGPRICIAMRFAVMEVKTCVARIMSQYTVKLSSKTKLPLTMSKRTHTPSVEGGVWLSFEKRKKT